MFSGRIGTETKVAVVDVGYNSLKMVKYRVEEDGFAKSYGQLGVMAKLGENLEHTGYLGEEPMARTIGAIGLCRETASLESIKHVLLVGTSPVREAANKEEFVRRVKEETGFAMRVLSGNEEALYGFLGGAKSIGSPFALFFDLGGGSLQLTYSERFKIRRILSFPLGGLRLSSVYAGKQGRYSRKDRDKMNRLITGSLPSRREFGLSRSTVLVGTGGTVRAMARYHQDHVEYPFNKVHNYVIDYESVQQMSREFFRLDRDELGRLDVIGEGRSETIAAGAFVVRLLMKRLGFEHLTVSTHGLRDGILAEFLQQGSREVESIALKGDIESLVVGPVQPPAVTGSTAFFDCLVKNGVFTEREREILAAALERGRTEESFEADANSLFWILMNEDLPMNHQDQLFMAVSLVKARRPRAASWLVGRFGDILLRDDLKALKKMATCLRLLEILDRSSSRYKVSFSGGVRIAVSDSAGPFPMELATAAADAFSLSIRKPVMIALKSSTGKRDEESVAVKG